MIFNNDFHLPPMPDDVPCGAIPKWDISNLRHRHCPTCEEDAPRVICIRPDWLKVHQCNQCDMIYLAEIPNETDLEKLYKSYGEYKGYAGTKQKPKSHSLFRKIKLCRNHIFIQILENFDGLSNIRLCEIGASYGDFLQLARFRGAKVAAVELDESAVLYMNESLKIESYYSISELPEMQDVICAKSVFEHLPFPGKILKEISEKLSEDGRLLLSAPNGTNFDVLGSIWAGARVDMEHLNYWTPKTLANLLARYGFYIEQHWELNQLATNRTNIRQSFGNRLFQNILSKNNWSPTQTGRATLVVLARHIKQV